MTAGAIRFARYAYPPNLLGYCGSDDHGALFEYGTAGVVDGGLRALARDFEGAWPYLELIAGSARLDPLDEKVVEAYWIGNRLLEKVDLTDLGHDVEARFRHRAGSLWDAVDHAVGSGVKPNHAYHVFCVYPWVGLMRAGFTDQPLRVLDRCRIRWGRVLAVEGDWAKVESRPLLLEEDRLVLGPSQTEDVVWADEGDGLAGRLDVGDLVAMHWDWVCERIESSMVEILRRETTAALGLANQVLGRPRTGVFS